MTSTSAPADPMPPRFSSLDELRQAHGIARAAHEDWVKAERNRIAKAGVVPDGGAAERHAAEIEAFIARASATGASIGSEDDRRAGRAILEYWAAELVLISETGIDEMAAPRLADYAGRPDDAGMEASTITLPTQATRDEIRFGASARLWKENGRSTGYLLYGKALTEARKFSAKDKDIADLVAASERLQRGGLIGLVAVLAMALMALIGVVAWLWYLNSELTAKNLLFVQLNKELKISREAAEADRLAAISRRDAAEAEAAISEQLRRQSDDAALRAQARLGELELIRRELDAALGLIRTETEAGRMREPIPEVLREALALQASTDQAVKFPAAGSVAMQGYDPHFLDLTDAPTAQSAEQPLALPQSGRQTEPPLDYPNFTIVLDTERRLPAFSASNVDRSQLRVLQRVYNAFNPDPRLPRDRQPNPAWFTGDLQVGRLVSAAEVAWGPLVAGDAAAAARRLAGVIDVYPNSVPQHLMFNQDVWSRLVSWIVAHHNPLASKVTILGGPVFGADDPLIEGSRVPKRFWRVAISKSPENGFAVDAFLLDQTAPAGDNVKPDRTDFDPSPYRVTIREIERVTGLAFPASIRSADDLTGGYASALQTNVTNTRRFSQSKMFSPTQFAQTAGSAIPEQDAVATAARITAASTLAGLPPAVRAQSFALLARVSQAVWTLPDWLNLRAAVRRNVADAGAALAANTIPADADVQGSLDTLRNRLGWDVATNYTVYLQFAGMVRADAVEVSQDMQALGWSIPGEERTAKAAGFNQVRYGVDADAAAAQLLAADLRADGLASVAAKQVPIIKRGTLEIWISR